MKYKIKSGKMRPAMVGDYVIVRLPVNDNGKILDGMLIKYPDDNEVCDVSSQNELSPQEYFIWRLGRWEKESQLRSKEKIYRKLKEERAQSSNAKAKYDWDGTSLQKIWKIKTDE